MTESHENDVFISYSRKDTDIVLPVVRRLESEGYFCWMDVNGIESGDAFKRVLVKAIKNSKIVLFFSSENSNNTEWTVKEINIAVATKKTIVPVRLDDAPYEDSILFDLSGLDYVPYQTDAIRTIGIERLLRSVATKCGPIERKATVFENSMLLNDSPACEQEDCSEPMHGDSKIVTLPDGVTLEMIYCPPGKFMMGSQPGEDGRSDNEILHLVSLSKGFWLGKHPITQRQWKSVMGSNPSCFSGNDLLPVDNISWDMCMQFIERVTPITQRDIGGKARFPTEAEWEYACRAGANTAYSWGNSLNGDMANCDGNYPCGTKAKGPYLQTTSTVGRYGSNCWGFCDMHGNVLEWCQDWYDSYPPRPVIDPVGSVSGASRILRGGCWSNSARYCRSAARYSFHPGRCSSHYGLRLACSAGILQ